MQNRQNGLISVLFLVIIVTLSVIGISYFAYKNNYFRFTTSDNFPSPPSDRTSNLDTSNWKTFTNKTYKYSFKYAPDQIVIGGNSKFVTLEGRDADHPKYAPLSFGILDNPTNLVLMDWFKAFYSEDVLASMKYSEVEINNNRLIKFKRANDKIDSYFLRGDKVIIWVNPMDLKEDNLAVQTQENEKVLSTFSFIDLSEVFDEKSSDSPVVTFPKKDTKITSPLIITGTVPPGWMFEGVFPIKLLDDKRNVISEGRGEEVVPGSWQSGSSVEFRGKLEFTRNSGSGFLMLENDNPSGLPENSKLYEIPVVY